MTQPTWLDALAEELRAAGYDVSHQQHGPALSKLYVFRNHEERPGIWSDGEVTTSEAGTISEDDWPAIRIIDRHLVAAGLAPAPVDPLANAIARMGSRIAEHRKAIEEWTATYRGRLRAKKAAGTALANIERLRSELAIFEQIRWELAPVAEEGAGDGN